MHVDNPNYNLLRESEVDLRGSDTEQALIMWLLLSVFLWGHYPRKFVNILLYPLTSTQA